ncbi:MAG TPA: SlyX family protein [Xanthomonadaceae bacterium]|nr:SlyX family protein [Xanthomonadaceae bacterium]
MAGSDDAALDRLEARVVELEMRVAFQDDTIAALNAAVLGRSAELEALGRRLEQALQDLEKLRGLQYPDPGSEPPPPHY